MAEVDLNVAKRESNFCETVLDSTVVDIDRCSRIVWFEEWKLDSSSHAGTAVWGGAVLREELSAVDDVQKMARLHLPVLVSCRMASSVLTVALVLQAMNLDACAAWSLLF